MWLCNIVKKWSNSKAYHQKRSIRSFKKQMTHQIITFCCTKEYFKLSWCNRVVLLVGCLLSNLISRLFLWVRALRTTVFLSSAYACCRRSTCALDNIFLLKPMQLAKADISWTSANMFFLKFCLLSTFPVEHLHKSDYELLINIANKISPKIYWKCKRSSCIAAADIYFCVSLLICFDLFTHFTLDPS